MTSMRGVRSDKGSDPAGEAVRTIYRSDCDVDESILPQHAGVGGLGAEEFWPRLVPSAHVPWPRK